MANFLDKIVAHKTREVARSKQQRPAAELEKQLDQAPPVRDFASALAAAAGTALIAEIKKASPSAGVIRADFDPVDLARIYERHGAACLSVLTDETFFQGRLEYLSEIRTAVALPLLRKDFLLDRYQVLEARLAGADCVLLIAECLDDCTLNELFRYAQELGMQSLVECYREENLQRVLDLEPKLLGINNRNLVTFEVDLEHTIRLKDRAGEQTLLIAESGVASRDDVLRLQAAGVGAILVGETLMRAPQIGAKVDELLGRA